LKSGKSGKKNEKKGNGDATSRQGNKPKKTQLKKINQVSIQVEWAVKTRRKQSQEHTQEAKVSVVPPSKQKRPAQMLKKKAGTEGANEASGQMKVHGFRRLNWEWAATNRTERKKKAK